MGLIFATGFEHGSTLNGESYISTVVNLAMAIDTSPVKSGTYSMRLRNALWEYILPTSDTEMYMGAWIYFVTGTGDGEFMRMELADGKLISIRKIGTTNALPVLYIDGVLTATGTSSNLIDEASWTNFQLRVLINDSTGVIQLKQDGETVIDYSGDTQPGTAPNNIVQVGFQSSGNYDIWFDDVVVRDDGWPGDIRIEGLLPTADTATADWTPSTGVNNYAVVDERPSNTTDYVSSTVNADQDLYDITDYNATSKTPKGVVLWNRAQADVASGQSLIQLANSGATLDSSASKALTNAWEYFYHVMENDPNTASAWTDSALDALQVGQESVI